MGIDVYTVPFDRAWYSLKNEIVSIVNLSRVIKYVKPSLLHTVTIKPNLYGLFVSWYYSIPIVCNVSGLGILYSSSNTVYAFVRKLLETLFKIFIKVSNSFMFFENNTDLSLYRDKGIVNKINSSSIPGAGVDENQFQYALEPESKNVSLLFASRMLHSKGVHTILEASKILKEKKINIKINFAGILDYESPDSINENEIVKWDSEGLISWLGEVKHMPNLINKSHVVIMPTTYQEGIPRIIIEALACGRPVITTNVAGCNEIITNGVNGIIIPINDPVSLAEAIIKLVNNPELREIMGKKGREIFLKKYSNSIVFKYTFNTYQRLLNST